MSKVAPLGKVTRCGTCKSGIVWAITVASETSRGGKRIPLDPYPDENGNVAVRVGHGGTLYARVLRKDESHDQRAERLAVPHFATCLRAEMEEIVEGFEQLLRGGTEAGQ